MVKRKKKKKGGEKERKKRPGDNGNLSVDSRVGDNYRFMDARRSGMEVGRMGGRGRGGGARHVYTRGSVCSGAPSRYASGNGLVSATLCRAITSS